MSDPSIQVFDPQQELAIVERRLPHWSQPGTISFITWRTWDSIPKSVVRAWMSERDAWLTRQGIDPADDGWQTQLEALDAPVVREFRQRLSDRWNDHLDECHGECVLREPALSQIVADCLLHFDGDRYEMLDFVVMPNHVHLLVAFPESSSILKQCASWKHFTATTLNRLLDRKGRFWQSDSFDHLVRSIEQFQHLRRYIAENPRRANLCLDEFVHWTKSSHPAPRDASARGASGLP